DFPPSAWIGARHPGRRRRL
ncbi:MAG: hypothetical protein AVDCRST_MAG10-2094, partial [uncultured Acidimicrobiales bacterium]